MTRERLKILDITVKKFARAAPEIKLVLQPAYVSELNRKSKALSAERNTVSNSEKKSNEPRWMHLHSAGQKKLARRLEKPKKTLQQQKKALHKQILLSKLSAEDSRNNGTDLSPSTDVVKITTIVETIRRKRQNAQMSGATRYARRTMRKKRSKRSFRESERSTKRRYRDQRKEASPLEKRMTGHDLKVTGDIAIPSTVFYKRIWEYINGTRPHSDIIGGYSALESNSEENSSICASQDRAISPIIKPERQLYERIWDIINATRSTYEGARTRSERDASIPGVGISEIESRSCTQKRKADHDASEQTTNEKEVSLNTAQEISQLEPYLLNFSAVVIKIPRQPEAAIQTESVVKPSDESSLSPRTNAARASETADLNKFPNEARDSVRTFADNSTKLTDEASNESREITEPGPPYSSLEDKSALSLFSPTERMIESTTPADARGKNAERYPMNNPTYDPSKIPYVEVPDYSDQRQESLDKNNNQSSSTAEHEEYDDSDYVDPQARIRNIDYSWPSAGSSEIESLSSARIGNDVQDSSNTSLGSNTSRTRCAENEDFAECTDNYEAEDTDLRNNTETDTNGDVHRSTEDSAENITADYYVPQVHFDINEYRKPFDLDDFLKNDPAFEDIQATSSKEQNASYNDEEEDDKADSEESEAYAAYPNERSYNYFTGNEESDENSTFDEGDEDKKTETGEETKDSKVINEHHYSDKDFLEQIFGESDDETSDAVDPAESEFLSRYFTEDILRQIRENSTTEEDRKREESRNKENIHKTLSNILDKKNRFSRLDEDLNKMIEKGETVPIKYNNFWSLKYELPRKKKNDVKGKF